MLTKENECILCERSKHVNKLLQSFFVYLYGNKLNPNLIFAVRLDALDCVSSSYLRIRCHLHMCTKLGFISHSLYIVVVSAIVVCLPVVHSAGVWSGSSDNQLKTHLATCQTISSWSHSGCVRQDMQRIESVLSSEQLRQGWRRWRRGTRYFCCLDELEALLESVLKASSQLSRYKDLGHFTVS